MLIIMCMLFIFSNPNPKPDGYCLVLASIRDEFLMRPSRECHFWDQNPDIVGGKFILLIQLFCFIFNFVFNIF